MAVLAKAANGDAAGGMPLLFIRSMTRLIEDFTEYSTTT